MPVPLDCVDGFNEAYYGRPEALLDHWHVCPARRGASSTRPRTGRFAEQLGGDLDSGRWDDRFGHLRSQPTFDGSLVLVVSEE